MIRYRVKHETRYVYSDPVSLCHNVAHLSPRESARQHVEESFLTITPTPANRIDQPDYFGNFCTHFTVQDPHQELTLIAEHVLKVEGTHLPEQSPSWEHVRDLLIDERSRPWLEALQFRFASPLIPTDERYAEYARKSFFPNRPITEAALDLTQRICKEFTYDPKATNVTTTVREVFENRRGVCQDFAHFQIACLRSLGLAARYISGYLMTTSPPGRPRLIGADASHAWVSLFCGEVGWLAFDPTNNGPALDRHILLAWGRDYSDVSPVKGVILGGGQHEVKVSVDCQPLSS